MFSDRLRAARRSRGLTLQKMADAAGVELRSYQRYEGGESEPAYAILVPIADALDVPVDFLLCRDEYLKSLGVSVDVSLECPPRRPKAQRLP